MEDKALIEKLFISRKAGEGTFSIWLKTNAELKNQGRSYTYSQVAGHLANQYENLKIHELERQNEPALKKPRIDSPLLDLLANEALKRIAEDALKAKNTPL